MCMELAVQDDICQDGEILYALRLTVIYSDTFPIARGCHCNRLDLYLLWKQFVRAVTRVV